MANQGGSHEQHVKAGQQSHKNSDKMTKSASSSSDSKSGKQGGSSDQHKMAGQQSNKGKH